MTWFSLKGGLLCLALLGTSVAGALAVDQFMRWQSRPRAVVQATPANPEPMTASGIGVGGPAHDFSLPLIHGDRQLRLSSYRGRKPVVLAFGSFSCWIFDTEIKPLDELHHKYGDRVAFVMVNVREIIHHHNDFKFLYDDYQPSETFAKRRQRVRRAVDWLKLSMPVVMDGPDAEVDLAYHAWPTRLVVVDRRGRIAYYGGTPMDNDPQGNLRELTVWLEAHLEAISAPGPGKRVSHGASNKSETPG